MYVMDGLVERYLVIDALMSVAPCINSGSRPVRNFAAHFLFSSVSFKL